MVKVSTDIGQAPGTRFTLEFYGGSKSHAYEYAIRWFLERQPRSWGGLADDIEEMLELIYEGYYSVAFLRDNLREVYTAFLLYSFQKRPRGIQVTIEMVSCNKFHRTAQFLDQVERWFFDFGCYKVRTPAHPVLANYLMKKQSYHLSGVIVEKVLDPKMRH